MQMNDGDGTLNFWVSHIALLHLHVHDCYLIQLYDFWLITDHFKMLRICFIIILLNKVMGLLNYVTTFLAMLL